MYIGFALKIKDQIGKIFAELIDGTSKEIVFQIPTWPRKRAQPTGAFGASQIACGGGLDGDRDRPPPLNGALQPACELK